MEDRVWNESSIHAVFVKQREFFRTGKTLDINWRIEQLKKLKTAVEKYEDRMTEALGKDLGRHPMEAYFCDVGSVILEINEIIRGLRRWARPETHFSGLLCFPSVITKVYKIPYGTTLIISPFNFPFLLSLGVLAASLAGGNTAVMKASSKSPASTETLKSLIADTFPPEYVTVIDGGHDAADLCLAERADKIFYTGSPNVGKHVLEMASRNLTPAALELGGENGNWCIVRKDADLRDAARKIVFMKSLNSGQVCININQVAVAEEVAGPFIEELRKEICRQVGEHSCENPEYPRMITEAAFRKCQKDAETYGDRIVIGGKGDEDKLKFDITVLYPVDIGEGIVDHELFCPILPIVPFADSRIDELLREISDREHGLSLYLFTKDIGWAKRTMQSQQFGGGCINEVCYQLMVRGVPFNGTGHSGMGAYHGEWGFREFTHPQTVLIGSTKFNLPLREHPYGEKNSFKEKLIRLFER